jgi:C-terminal processing protease CtpA/Prc
MYLLVFFGTGLFVLVWLRPHQRDLFTPGFWRNIIHVGQVMLLVNHDYVEPEKADYDALSESSLKQMLHGLDEYSGYMDRDDYAEFSVQTDQHYAGIGAEVERLDGRVTIAGLLTAAPRWSPGSALGTRSSAWTAKTLPAGT